MLIQHVNVSQVGDSFFLMPLSSFKMRARGGNCLLSKRGSKSGRNGDMNTAQQITKIKKHTFYPSTETLLLVGRVCVLGDVIQTLRLLYPCLYSKDVLSYSRLTVSSKETSWHLKFNLVFFIILFGERLQQIHLLIAVFNIKTKSLSTTISLHIQQGPLFWTTKAHKQDDK